jgi:hypothetical protein
MRSTFTGRRLFPGYREQTQKPVKTAFFWGLLRLLGN